MTDLHTVVIPLSGADEPLAREFSAAWSGECIFSSSAQRAGRDDLWTVTWFVFGMPDRVQTVSALCVVAALCGIDPQRLDFKALEIAPVPERDWLVHVHESHPPFSVGKFFVYGGEWAVKAPCPPGLIPLEIDAASAFGSGEHGTTSGCLEALGILADKGFTPRQTLDMGTGSGILAIAAWKLWRRPVLAVDIDRESVRVACVHRARNAVPAGAEGMICKQGGKFSIAAIHARAPFDLVIANILAAPLKDMAHDLSRALAPGGFVILSGMLRAQADEVAGFYRQEKLNISERIDCGEWTTLILCAK